MARVTAGCLTATTLGAAAQSRQGVAGEGDSGALAVIGRALCGPNLRALRGGLARAPPAIMPWNCTSSASFWVPKLGLSNTTLAALANSWIHRAWYVCLGEPVRFVEP